MDLPIYAYKEQILKTCYEQQFVIITGDTGSGKSTQLPQYLLDCPKMRQKLRKSEKSLNIVVTQPRRMAAISMAKRLCQERNKTLGKEIGYTIRFDDFTSSETTLRYVTDGILVRECLSDPDLSKYQVVILDEAHERSLYTDILFSLVKKAVENRKGELQLIVTSATLDSDRFSIFFNNCPKICMEGRCFPVDIKYGPCLSNKRIEESVTAAIRMHLHEGPGDILVFLTGSEECEQAAKLCLSKLQMLLKQGAAVPGMIIYSLYGTQASEEQNQIFIPQPENIRKLIFSTNIAETSLTIPNIAFVIDCGYVKQKNYNPRTNMDALITVPISKVQAIQRAGRAGRTQAGKCYRMYTEQFFKNQMLEYTIPEILRVNLSNTILQLKAMGIDDVVHFGYMEEPDEKALLEGLRQLFLLGAIDEDGFITGLGKELSRFPLEPSYGKTLMTSKIFGCDRDMITLVSLLSTEQIYTKVSRTNEDILREFEKIQSWFCDMNGDHQTLLKIYNKWINSGQSNDFCRSHFLNTRALKQTENIRIQIQDISDMINIKLIQSFYENDPIYKQFKQITGDSKLIKSNCFKMALASGFFFNSARQMINNPESYIVIHDGTVVSIDPSSVYSIKNIFPNYVIFTELSGTSVARGTMRQVTEIEFDWVKDYANIINKVDILRLAKIQAPIVKKIKLQENTQDLQKNQDDLKKNKIEQAKLRYQERTKIKT